MTRCVRVASLGIALALWPTLAHSQARQRVAVPRQVVVDIHRDTLWEIIPESLDSLAANLVAEPMDLDEDGTPELVVMGQRMMCGAANCPAWIYRRTSSGWELMVVVGSIQTIEMEWTVSHGYRDILVSQHGSAFDSEFRRYSYDGRRYRPVFCYDSRYHVLDSHGEIHELKRPMITPVECQADG